jgi:hypothetical protein
MKMITNLLTLFVQVKEGYVECKKAGRSKKPQLVVVFSELSAVNHLKNIHHLLLPCEVRLQKILILSSTSQSRSGIISSSVFFVIASLASFFFFASARSTSFFLLAS